jgi:hypothetical protein
LTFLEFEEFSMTTAVMKRGEVAIHTVYVVASPQRVTVARASGNTAAEAMANLLEITSA